MWRVLAIILVSCAIATTGISPAYASDHDHVRADVQAGAALPLGEILKRLPGDYSGRLLDADLEHRRGGSVYELRLLNPSGQVLTVVVNAQNGRILQSR